MKLGLVASGSKLALAIGVLSFTCSAASAQDSTAQGDSDQALAAGESAPENVIVVSGVRQSIESAIDDKRNATEIKDSITAEDIGQLANDNIAEALQRITGVQVNRGNDGEGKNVQIRGLSENNVTLNGATASGTGDVDLSNGNDRSVNFQDLPAELFAGVEILKALTADQIEGTLGGTINLQTRAPLSGKRDFIVNLSGTGKFSEVGDLRRQDANVFVQKKFLDTPLGDFGVILNFGYKEIASIANVYGGGEFEDAPGIWLRMTGDAPATSAANIFANANIGGAPNPYRQAIEDVNGDGVANGDDVYYMPRAFQTSSRFRDDTRKSFNGTLQWKPAANLDVRFDAVITDLDQSLTGSNMNWIVNPPRAGFLIGGPGNVFEPLSDTPEFGQTYVMTAGRLGSFNTRVGAAPSINEIARRSEQYSLEATWEATPNLTLYAKGTSSLGKATTLNFGQLSAAIEDQGGANPVFGNDDNRNIVDFDLGSGQIPFVTFYQSPFVATNFGVTSLVQPANLVAIDPGDLSYARYRYFQFQRNAADTRNTDDSFRFDATWEPDANFLEAIKAGFRWAERSFERQRWENQSQGGGNVNPYTEWDGTRDPARVIAIQRIPVDPANTGDAGARATSQFMQPCIESATTSGELARFGGNFPDTWQGTGGCDIAALTNYFNMLDIRAIDPVSGAGYYEIKDERFEVSEETLAAYLRADFNSAIGSVPFFGNVGLRHVKTKMDSTGYLQNAGTPVTYELITFEREYSDWLPSANLNFAFSKDLIGRLAYSRTLGRPTLSQVSPGLELNRTTEDPEVAGNGTAGNPFLNPVHADNFDASLEWYYDKGSYISVAVFKKDIDSTIFLDPERITRDINGELFRINTYRNFGGTKLKGVELGMAHAFNYLPGILSHLGVTANLTLIDESSDLRDQEGDPISRKGLSDTTYNLTGYYDDGGLSLRMAYNWRSEFTRREITPLSFNSAEALPETEAARGQLDFSARYKINRNLRLTFNAVNITDTGTRRYLKYPVLVNYLSVAGRKYDIGVALSF